ncbi:uncharacterized protein M437DRAFT_60950, partial [Aureobasidium melanogenum CBS 110374]
LSIVAVHGIGAHPDDNWCKIRGADLDAMNPENYVNWLSDSAMLPEVIPNTRITRYCYKSVWFGPDAIKQNSSRVAQRLLLALRRERKDFPFRPLIFIAHCFGGLVMLQAARSEYEQEEVLTEVLRILDPGNELLQDLVDSFGKARSLQNRAQVASFYELQSSNVGAIVGKQKKKVRVVSYTVSHAYYLRGSYLLYPFSLE